MRVGEKEGFFLIDRNEAAAPALVALDDGDVFREILGR
jgi:hypothetical protein